MTLATIAHSGGAEIATRPARPQTALMRANLEERWRFAEALANAGLLPRAYQKAPANLLLAFEKAEMLGIHHVAAIESIHVIEGRTGLSGALMRALIIDAGHGLVVREQTAQRCVIWSRRSDDGVEHVDTVEIGSIPARLRNKDTWRDWPARMLLARCTGNVANAHFADVLHGMVHTREELEDLGPAPAGPAPVAAALMAAATTAADAVPVDEDRLWIDETHDEIVAAPTTDILNGLARQIADAETHGLDPQAVTYLRQAMNDRAADLPAGKRALTRMHAALTALGLDDAQRKQAAGNVVGRTLESTSELTGAEADTVWRRAGKAKEDGGAASLLYPDGEVPPNQYVDSDGEHIPDGVGVTPDEAARLAAGGAA